MSRTDHAAPALAALLCTTACAIPPPSRAEPAQVVRGPLPLRTNGPLLQEFLALRPRRPETVAPGRAELQLLSAYSSYFENGRGARGSVTFDGELWRNSAIVRTGLAQRTDVEVELPVFFATTGFLDRFVETWHELFGLPRGGRGERSRFTYDMRVEADGREVYHLDHDRVGIGDVPIVLTQRIADETAAQPALALRAAVELPTGSEPQGFGNGRLDWGAGLVGEKSAGRWTFGGQIAWTRRGRPRSFEGSQLDVVDPLDASLSAECRWDDATSLVAGLRHAQAVSRDLGIKELSADVLELDLGIVRDLPGGSRLTFGMSEDVVARSGPDFTTFLGWWTGL